MVTLLFASVSAFLIRQILKQKGYVQLSMLVLPVYITACLFLFLVMFRGLFGV